MSNSIAHLNTAATFTPVQPLQDTDIGGYLKHAHEQKVISTMEEGRRETVEQLYRSLEERSSRVWEEQKKRLFEELGDRVGTASKALMETKKAFQKSHAVVSTFTDMLLQKHFNIAF